MTRQQNVYGLEIAMRNVPPVHRSGDSGHAVDTLTQPRLPQIRWKRLQVFQEDVQVNGPFNLFCEKVPFPGETKAPTTKYGQWASRQAPPVKEAMPKNPGP
jgi:hypothetical protein